MSISEIRLILAVLIDIITNIIESIISDIMAEITYVKTDESSPVVIVPATTFFAPSQLMSIMQE